MRLGQLRDYFVGVGAKRLSAVDAEPKKSNQHEVNTTKPMRQHFLGEEHRQQFAVVYVWLGQDQNGISVEGTATHYDARRRKPHRAPEWRLYYPSNPVTEAMQEGDSLFLAMTSEQLLYFIIAPQGSTSERQLSWLFNLYPKRRSFVSSDFVDYEPQLDFAARFVLDEIGIDFEDPDARRLDQILRDFGNTFPTTAVFSRVARVTLPNVRPRKDPDNALISWLNHERALFGRLERRVVSKRLQQGFVYQDGATDVDGFIRFSLSVQNRRKSRMGQSLEHHLAAILDAHHIAYDRGAVTENGHRPDFLFPSLEAYHAELPSGRGRLTMLGVKSTCKDRWRQVLAEAAKIPRKHLLTLEPGISEPQTTQMAKSQLQLVVPESIQRSYTDNQRSWLWNLRKFIHYVKSRE